MGHVPLAEPQMLAHKRRLPEPKPQIDFRTSRGRNYSLSGYNEQIHPPRRLPLLCPVLLVCRDPLTLLGQTEHSEYYICLNLHGPKFHSQYRGFLGVSQKRERVL